MTNGKQVAVLDEVKAMMSNPTVRERIGAALMGVVDGPAFAEQCIIAANDPALSKCSPVSLCTALMQCAQVGLTPGKQHGLVALIPRGGNVDLQIQWQGFKVLMERVPGIKRVRPVLVHRIDDFALDADGTVTHRYDPLADERVFRHPDTLPKGSQPDLRGGYLRIEWKDGTVDFHFVKGAKIEANRRCAQSQNVWRAWYEEMCLKTVIRDAWARRAVPYDPVAAAHMSAADELERKRNDERVVNVEPVRVRSGAALIGAPTSQPEPDTEVVLDAETHPAPISAEEASEIERLELEAAEHSGPEWG